MTDVDGGQLAEAAEQGRICALAARGQRDLQRRAAAHPDLFPSRPFDAALFSSIALAMAFSAPWCTAEELGLTNRAVLWGFVIDWQVDHQATSRSEVDLVAKTCLAVAGGAPADDPLGRFLAELRDDLAAAPAFAGLRGLWQEEIARTLAAMTREWEWKAAAQHGTAAPPTLAQYLDNADNLAATVVNVAHWIHTGSAETHRQLPRLVTVSDEVQRALRLINDLGTYQRDREWGDLNAIMLVDDDRAEIERQVATRIDHCRHLLAELRPDCPREADYLSRQLGFTSGFYRLTDFWGTR
ncbi:terpene synthase family protein [Micromonospora narathiwatensis]|uniref:Terpene synthase family, metal binding domain n=1 Tax=Micromonospora narathiwatensis TaxID=299146 RepID=A0A1A8ZUL5_9ACTN|nr:terpene synthase family protein [Micromonospora narathiwatensis]SBT47571.1 Terpene synthase family, metal binding domain [Micromonospora narathiwatensis]